MAIDITNLKYFFNEVIPEIKENDNLKLIVTFVYPRDNYLNYDYSIIDQECVFAEMNGKVVEYNPMADFTRITAEINTTLPYNIDSIRSIKTYFIELQNINNISFPDWYNKYVSAIFADENMTKDW